MILIREKYLYPVILIMFMHAGPVYGQSAVRVSGTVTDMNGVAIPQTVKVSAWSWVEEEVLPGGEVYTGYRVLSGHSAFVNPMGAYTLNLPPGEYKFNARVAVKTDIAPCPTDINPEGRESCIYPTYSPANARFWLEERWHEAGTGMEDHWVQEDATLVTVEEGIPITELNFRLRLGGAVRGRVRGLSESSPGSPDWLVGAKVRVEQVSDERRHHNSVTIDNPPGGRAERAGTFVSRGLRPALLQRVIVYDQEGHNRTYVHSETHTPSAGAMHDFGTINLQPMPPDGYPGNVSIETAVDIGRWNFDEDPPPVWTSSGARIAPRNAGVVNWFCWQVRPEDRFVVTASTTGTIEELPGRSHPWTDPILKVVRRDYPEQPLPGTEVDRYSGPGSFDAMIDTLLIQESGTYCAAVSMAGDENFDGTGQHSSGPYILTIERSSNPLTRPPELGGAFAAQCSGAVVTDTPMSIPVTHGNGDSQFDIHLQVYPFGTLPEEGLDIDIRQPADTGSDVTEVVVDNSSLRDNTRYTIRVRSYDGIYYSPWKTCDFWNNTINNPPTKMEILSPDPGTVLPLNTMEVEILVQNAYDPDLVVPGTSIEIAWCSSLHDDFSDCPFAVMDWNRLPQSSIDPSDTTRFTVDGLTNREAWYIRVCAMDETGLCGPSDQTWVVVGVDDEPHETTGCCAMTAKGDPFGAIIALLVILLMYPGKRRFVRTLSR